MKRRDFLAAAALPVLTGCEAPAEIAGGFTGINFERGHLLRDRRSWPAPASTQRTGVVIAGGGVAGLAAARALRQRGIEDFALLELEDQAGGNSRGGAVNGVPCPLGAHYLPVPGDDAREVQDLLEEFGLRQRVAGRWRYDERHLCHSPQERLFFNGAWQDGLLPLQGVEPETLAQYRRFAQGVARAGWFAIPVSKVSLAQVDPALDAMTFGAWLDLQQLTDPHLRWYLDYCCRDDYGAGIATVSAWAGLHYFASRHGFHAPGDGVAESEGVLTWPEGNAWLTRRLAAPLGGRQHTGQVVARIAVGRHGVEVDAFDAATSTLRRWQADHCIVALPLFVAARLVENPPPALREAAAQLRYAPWLVANVHLRAPLDDRPGAAPSWDNVVYDSRPGAEGLGYVDAMHQSLLPVPGATVLTCYRALGLAPARRQVLFDEPWTHWRDVLWAEFAAPHPDLPAKATRIDITRYGHAMSTPVPGIRRSAALAALQSRAAGQRLWFAHSDLSGYSIFEEALTHGHRVGSRVG
ncbi:hypothetical protein RD110_26515 [Rhodoferax koreense]|uniref:Amine oxidase domain-containing protein n=1 Tax=Rhodoferax koreensis TaxID=1842727 RepID=A0A1P8K2T3_9BURK|nr:FAD-dependent oxidoreductase [Rhodoferax koreense]APW40314.1 hypothetical protein RD110_26515 [Rhodoferax koreense]